MPAPNRQGPPKPRPSKRGPPEVKPTSYKSNFDDSMRPPANSVVYRAPEGGAKRNHNYNQFDDYRGGNKSPPVTYTFGSQQAVQPWVAAAAAAPMQQQRSYHQPSYKQPSY